MELVGQQELMQPPRPRRLIVAPGSVHWWGVDPSTSRVAICTVAPDGRTGHELVVFPKLEGVQRLSVIYEEVSRAACELAGLLPPGLVWTERMVAPKQRPVNPELMAAAAVIKVAVYDGVRRAGVAPPRVEEIVPSSWKLRACGRGNIPKPTKKRLGRTPVAEDYEVMVWAWANGMPQVVRDWDSADAMGLAVAASREVGLEPR